MTKKACRAAGFEYFVIYGDYLVAPTLSTEDVNGYEF